MDGLKYFTRFRTVPAIHRADARAASGRGSQDPPDGRQRARDHRELVPRADALAVDQPICRHQVYVNIREKVGRRVIRLLNALGNHISLRPNRFNNGQRRVNEHFPHCFQRQILKPGGMGDLYRIP